MNHCFKRGALYAAVVLITAGTAPTFAAQADPIASYPSKPVRFIVPFVAGAGTDTTGRVVAAKLSEIWKEQVVVDNRAGASGNIGSDYVAKAAPDGNTLLFTATSFGTNPAINKLPFDPVKDFTPVTQLIATELVLVATPKLTATFRRSYGYRTCDNPTQPEKN